MRSEDKACELLRSGNDGPLIAYDTLGRDAELSIPTPDHYLPLLYVIATRRDGDGICFPVDGVDGGSVSIPRGSGFAYGESAIDRLLLRG